MRYRTPVVVTILGRYACTRCGTCFAWQSERPSGGGKPPAYCSAECQSQEMRERRQARMPHRDCIVCGQSFQLPRQWPDQQVCSRACGTRARRPPRPRLPKPPSSPHPARIAECVVCSAPFEQKSARVKCCSERCRRRRYDQLKNERRSKVTAARRRYVFDRDDWTCWICGRLIPKGRRVPHPRAATVDHVVPRSAWPAGQPGRDDPANLRAAHLSCNASRGAAGDGGQLALVG